jgi:hypothetical protein
MKALPVLATSVRWPSGFTLYAYAEMGVAPTSFFRGEDVARGVPSVCYNVNRAGDGVEQAHAVSLISVGEGAPAGLVTMPKRPLVAL